MIDADLGGGVIKQRIGRPGAGKSGGYLQATLAMGLKHPEVGTDFKRLLLAQAEALDDVERVGRPMEVM